MTTHFLSSNLFSGSNEAIRGKNEHVMKPFEKLIKNTRALNERYTITNGLSFYDGPRSGIVKRLRDNKRFYFNSDQDENWEITCFLYDLCELQWDTINKYIILFEEMVGMHTRYDNDGYRLGSSHSEWTTEFKNKKWKEFCDICEEKKIGERYIDISTNKIFDIISYDRLFNKI